MEAERHSATLLILRSQVLFALVGVLSKLLGEQAPTLVVSFWLIVLVAFMLLLNAWAHRELRTLGGVNWGLAALRGMIVFAMTCLSIFAFQNLPLVESFALSFLAPVFQIVLVVVGLGRHVGWHRRTAALIGFAGLAIILRPYIGLFDHTHLHAQLAMVGAAALNAANYTILRHSLTRGGRNSARRETPSLTALAAELCAALLALGAFGWKLVDQAPNSHVMAGLLLLGTIATLGIISNGEAYKRTDAAYLAPFNYLQLLWAGLAGWAIWGDHPDRQTLLGAGLIIVGGLYTVYRENRLRHNGNGHASIY